MEFVANFCRARGREHVKCEQERNHHDLLGNTPEEVGDGASLWRSTRLLFLGRAECNASERLSTISLPDIVNRLTISIHVQ